VARLHREQNIDATARYFAVANTGARSIHLPLSIALATPGGTPSAILFLDRLHAALNNDAAAARTKPPSL